MAPAGDDPPQIRASPPSDHADRARIRRDPSGSNELRGPSQEEPKRWGQAHASPRSPPLPRGSTTKSTGRHLASGDDHGRPPAPAHHRAPTGEAAERRPRRPGGDRGGADLQKCAATRAAAARPQPHSVFRHRISSRRRGSRGIEVLGHSRAQSLEMTNSSAAVIPAFRDLHPPQPNFASTTTIPGPAQSRLRHPPRSETLTSRRRKPCADRQARRLAMLVEQRDREAVKLRIRGLSNDLVHQLEVRIVANPIGDHLTKQLTLFGFGCRKHLYPSYIDHTELFLLNS